LQAWIREKKRFTTETERMEKDKILDVDVQQIEKSDDLGLHRFHSVWMPTPVPFDAKE
jgi:hypothetical protein